jgi:hypothetical protein
VWRHWLHAGGEIDALAGAESSTTESPRQNVFASSLAAMSDHDHVLRLIHDTDRKAVKRRRGEDIHAGALDHLLRNVEEALRLPRQWLGLVELLGGKGIACATFSSRFTPSCVTASVPSKLSCSGCRSTTRGAWCRPARRRRCVRCAGFSHCSMRTTELPIPEPTPAEVMGRPLLMIADLPVKEDWTSDTTAAIALRSLDHWLEAPLTAEDAGRQRLERGAVLGAELLIQAGMVDPAEPARSSRSRPLEASAAQGSCRVPTVRRSRLGVWLP